MLDKLPYCKVIVAHGCNRRVCAFVLPAGMIVTDTYRIELRYLVYSKQRIKIMRPYSLTAPVGYVQIKPGRLHAKVPLQ